MSVFREKYPEIVQSNPGGVQDPLGESIMDHSNDWCRVFEPSSISLVLGRNQNPALELKLTNAQRDGVPVYRRACGGGAVVLAPGSLVVALRLQHEHVGVDCYFAAINKALCAGLQECGVDAACHGHGDLAVMTDGALKKILGASLRQARGAVYYLAVFMFEDLVHLMNRYLKMPTKQPDYRIDRSHADFCTHLSLFGLKQQQFQRAIESAVRDHLGSRALLAQA